MKSIPGVADTGGGEIGGREKMELQPHNARETKISQISHTIGILVSADNHRIIEQYWS